MLVNLKEFWIAVTGESYKSNTEKVVLALERWKIPMHVPSNLPPGARLHRRVDVAMLGKAKEAYAAEQAREQAIAANNVQAAPKEKGVDNSARLDTINTLRRIERKVDRLLSELGVKYEG